MTCFLRQNPGAPDTILKFMIWNVLATELLSHLTVLQYSILVGIIIR